ncbi:hybrid sensor histidine kinase/response regulator [Azotosporobacter soli]|uniref:hybrid sensor histidine kinase/response regulator n=1 Tax=Azotosporobacter soli TaxID=3055040 RepID=UPI0031FF1BDA
MRELRVLLVEDSEDDAAVILYELENAGYSVSQTRVDNAAALTAALSERKWDLVLSDYTLPGFNAIAALRILHASGLDLPFIIVTGTISEEIAVSAMKAGANDYVMKDRLQRLAPAIERELYEVKVRREAKKIQSYIEKVNTLSGIIEQSPILVLIIDRQGRVQYVNKCIASFSGQTSEEIIGYELNLEDLALYSETDCNALWAAVTSDQIWRGEIQNKRGDGQTYWALSSAVPLHGAEGEISGYVVTQQDITTLKEVELQLRANNEELASALQALKQTQESLLQQEKMAALGQLAAGVAHEINTPLGFVNSNFSVLQDYFTTFTEILRAYQQLFAKLKENYPAALLEECDDVERLCQRAHVNTLMEDIDDLFKESKDGFERILSIVKALRLFSRKDDAAFSDYDLNQGIENTLIMTRNETKYSIEVKTSLVPLPLIQAIANKINQVLLNLIVNAVHAVEESERSSGGCISITTWHDDSFVYCSIQDNGTGIPEQIRKAIFDPFFTTKPAGKGTGLGLSICNDIIVNLHKGIIDVDSVLGEGTTFTIQLPIDATDKEFS